MISLLITKSKRTRPADQTTRRPSLVGPNVCSSDTRWYHIFTSISPWPPLPPFTVNGNQVSADVRARGGGGCDSAAGFSAQWGTTADALSTASPPLTCAAQLRRTRSVTRGTVSRSAKPSVRNERRKRRVCDWNERTKKINKHSVLCVSNTLRMSLVHVCVYVCVCARAYDDVVWYAHVQWTAGPGDTADDDG